MKKKKFAIQKLGNTFTRSGLLNGIQEVPGINVQTSDLGTVVIPFVGKRMLEAKLRTVVRIGTTVICPIKRIIRSTLPKPTDMNPRNRIIISGSDMNECRTVCLIVSTIAVAISNDETEN
jgi:hypothetical protein